MTDEPVRTEMDAQPPVEDLQEYDGESIDANVIPVDRLADIIRAGDMLQKMLKKVRERALEVMSAGGEVPGMKLTRTQVKRTLTDTDTLSQQLQDLGLRQTLAPQPVTRLIPALKRAVKAGAISEKTMDDIVKQHVGHSGGNLQAVTVESTGEPVDPATLEPDGGTPPEGNGTNESNGRTESRPEGGAR